MIDNYETRKLSDAIKATGANREGTVSLPAQVLGTDTEGVTWVQVVGSDEKTPLSSTTSEVSKGDVVNVTIGNGRAFATGNFSDPSAGMTRVVEVEHAANEAAKGAASALEASVSAVRIAQEAAAASSATSQHFWHRSDNPDGAGAGAFVTDIERDDFVAAAADGFSDWQADDPEAADYKPYMNSLWNALGLFFRTAKNNLVSMTKSAIAFFDGDGNSASNIVASFGSDGVVIGRTNESHALVDFHSLRLLDKEGRTYFHVSDLRDKSGVALMTHTVIANGEAKSFVVPLTLTRLVSATDSSDDSNTATATDNRHVEFMNTPSSGATVTIIYETTDGAAKAYTLGVRASSAPIGAYSFAEGFGSKSTAYASHAEGGSTSATGAYSHAEGYNTSASWMASHAEGESTSAAGRNSHAEGDHSTAEMPSSHAEGYYTEASGLNSHAEGSHTVASGWNSHAGGSRTIANSNAQTVIGMNNIPDPTTTTAGIRSKQAVIIGNGTSDTDRSNALTVGWDDLVSLMHPDFERGTPPSSTQFLDRVALCDANGELIGYLRTPFQADGREGVQLETKRVVNGSNIYHGIQLYIDASGNRTVDLSDAAAWRSALEAVAKTGDTMTGELSIGQSSGDTFMRVERTDAGVEVGLGVGSGGANHGVYSWKQGRWLLHGGANGKIYAGGEPNEVARKQTRYQNGRSYAFTIPEENRISGSYQHALIIGAASLNSTGAILGVCVYRYSAAAAYLNMISSGGKTLSAAISGNTLTITSNTDVYGGLSCQFF